MNSTDYPAAPRKSKKRLLIWLAVLLGAPLLLLGTWCLFYAMSNNNAASRLEQKARKRGEPVTLADIEKQLPAVSDADNAALALIELWKPEHEELWQAFLDGVRPLPQPRSRDVRPDVPIVGSRGERPSRTNGLSASALALASTHLKEQAAYLEGLHAALRRPGCRFPIRIAEGYTALLPHLSRLRADAQLLRLEAVVATERGDADAAINALTNAARCSEFLATEPFFISQLVRLACAAITVQGTEYLVSRRALTAIQLSRVEALLERLSLSDGLKTSYLGERASILGAFTGAGSNPAQSGADGEGNASAGYLPRGTGALRLLGLAAADRRLLLQTFDTVLREVDDDTPEALARRMKVFEAAVSEARRLPPKIYSGLMLGGMSKAGERFASAEAKRRAAQVAVAVERHRLANGGKVPLNLDALVPKVRREIPADPFDGQPLRFRVGAPGYVIYSVGSDLQDNLGLERPPGATRGKDEFDDTFIIGR